MFPVYASGSLLSLYLLFKFFDKNLINYLLTAYFVIIGIGALVSVALTASRAITGRELKGDYELTFKVKAKSVSFCVVRSTEPSLTYNNCSGL